MDIFELSEKPDLVVEATHYFWKQWGSDSNFKFYEDCILNSLDTKNAIPKFYIGMESDMIIGSYALITNDLISRMDLMPWLACLYVDEAYRKRGYAEQLLNHGLAQTKSKGFKNLYLSTDLINFYERKGWTNFGVGYSALGGAFTIYSKKT